MQKKKGIYLDYAAATPVAAPVLKAMKPYFADSFANPSSLHSAGVAAEHALRESAHILAKRFGCQEDEIIFTSGGTESINMALKGVIGAKPVLQHIMSSNIEHPATLETLQYLKKQGHEVTLVPCDNNGVVKADDVLAAITPKTTLISLILVQNEIGTIQPVTEIGRQLISINRVRSEHGLPPVLIHVDACQAPAVLDIRIPMLHADLASFDAAKCYGPKGSGLLIARRGIELAPLMHGGGQQKNKRSGTEAVPLIVGAAAAFEYCAEKRQTEAPRFAELSRYLMKRIQGEIPHSIICGAIADRAPHIVNAAFANIEGESLVLRLDRAGIAASTGSACSSVSGKPSHVITALHLPGRYRPGSLRISLGYGITKVTLDRAFLSIKRTVAQLRDRK